MRRHLFCSPRSLVLLTSKNVRWVSANSGPFSSDHTSTKPTAEDVADAARLKEFHKSSGSSANSTKMYSQSGTPTRAGTEAAMVSMRLRRMANAEELERDREEMLRSQRVGSSASNEPTDDEVKAWRARKNDEEAAELLEKQRLARDAFVRDILGTTPPLQKAPMTSPTSMRNGPITEAAAGTSTTRRTTTSTTANAIPKTASFASSTAKGEITGENSKYIKFGPDGKPIAEDSGRVDPQANQKINEYPEETAERLREAASKYGKTLDTNYGVADLDYNGRKLMITLGFCAIFFVFIPLYVDPFGSLGEERGGKGYNEREAIRRQQEKNVITSAAIKKKRKDGEADDEDDFYGSSSTLSAQNAHNESRNVTDTATDNNTTPNMLTRLNPLMMVASYANWYLAVLRNINTAREEMAAGAGVDRLAKERIQNAESVLSKMKKGDS